MSVNLEQQLANTQQALARLEAEYQAFVYTVSHDMRAPLRQIEGFSEIILEKNSALFDEKTKHYFDLIIKGTAQSKELLDALTCYSRLHSHAQPFEELDLNQVIIDVKALLCNTIASTRAQISVSKLPIIVGDKNQITQLFYHLVHNALLYCKPDTPPVINISVESQSNQWQFSVKDTGIGIAEKQLDTIFKILKRAVSNKTYEGMGMGLAIAQKILHRHQGDIWVKTEKGIGSEFLFCISKDLSRQ